jgi:hypothetical protein
MIETLTVIEAIIIVGRDTNGQSKEINTRKGIKSGDGLAVLSRFRLALGTANAAQGTASEKSGPLKLEAAGTVSPDSLRMMLTGKSLQRRVGHYLLRPSRSQ